MLSRSLLASLACLLLLTTAAAQEADEIDAQPTYVPAPVRVDGVDLFNVTGSASFPAEERARNVAARIVAVAAQHKE